MSRFRRMLLSNQGTEYNLDDIMMTSVSNPEVMKICYLNGFAKNRHYMTYREASDVKDTEKFNTAFNNSDIKYFNEAKYFTGLTGTVSFRTSYLKEFSFPPNCEVAIGGCFPNCKRYDLNVFDGTSMVNGPQNIANTSVDEFMVDKNNHYYGVVDGHLGYGQLAYRKYYGNGCWWIIPNPKDGVFIMPQQFNMGNRTSVSLLCDMYQGHTIISNTYATGNVNYGNGGNNVKKIIVYGESVQNDGYNSAFYSGSQYYLGKDVPSDVKKQFIVSNDCSTDFDSYIFTDHLFNPSICNFELKRVNFGITIYNEKVLFKLNGLHDDEWFMTQEECANVPSVGIRFKNSNITNFNEFKYFTGVKEIEDYAFYNCKDLTNITLPDSVTRIGAHSFSGCTNLKSIFIPNSVTEIDESAFEGCDIKLLTTEDITAVEYLQSTGTQYIDTLINGNDDDLEITIDFSYSSASPSYAGIYGNYSSDQNNMHSLRVINNNTVYQTHNTVANGGTTSLTLPVNSRTTLVSKKDFVILNGVEIKRENISKGNTNNNNIIIFTNLSTWNNNLGLKIYSFKIEKNGTILRDLIPVSLNNIGYMYDRVSGKLFSNKGTGNFIVGPQRNYVEFSEGIIHIDQNLFKLNSIFVKDIKNIKLPSSLVSIDSQTFKNCSTIKSITIPSQVQSIGDYAFSGCTNLISIYMNPINAPSLGLNVFGDSVENYVGVNSNNNKSLIIPVQSTGYNDSDYTNILINKLGFSIIEGQGIIISKGSLCQYVNTNLIVQSTDEIYLKMEFVRNGVGDYPKIYGWRIGDGTSQGLMIEKRPDNMIAIFMGNTYINSSHLFEFHAVQSTGNITYNGVSTNLNTSQSYDNGSAIYPAYIFSTNIKGSMEYNYGDMKFYEYWVKDQIGNYRIHLIPKLHNNRPCLYDMVSGKYFYDENGNEFEFEYIIN